MEDVDEHFVGKVSEIRPEEPMMEIDAYFEPLVFVSHVVDSDFEVLVLVSNIVDVCVEEIRQVKS